MMRTGRDGDARAIAQSLGLPVGERDLVLVVELPAGILAARSPDGVVLVSVRAMRLPAARR